MNQLDDLALPLIGVDPSMVLCCRDEYSKILGDARGDFKVLLVHEWLLQLELPKVAQGKNTSLCTEKQWQQIFEKTGLNLSAVAVGCCGMAGIFLYEETH